MKDYTHMSDELQTLFPGKDVVIAGQTVCVRPFSFGQLPKVMKLMGRLSAPVLAAQNAGEKIDPMVLFGLLADGGDELIELMASSSGLQVSTIKNLESDEGIVLLAAFIEVNGSFFVQKVLPLVKELAQKHNLGLK